MASNPTSPPPAPRPQRSALKDDFVSLLILLAVVALVGGGYWFFRTVVFSPYGREEWEADALHTLWSEDNEAFARRMTGRQLTVTGKPADLGGELGGQILLTQIWCVIEERGPLARGPAKGVHRVTLRGTVADVDRHGFRLTKCKVIWVE